MAEICCELVGEGEAPAPIESTSRVSRRRGMDRRAFKYVGDAAVHAPAIENARKRLKIELFQRECKKAVERCVDKKRYKIGGEDREESSANEDLHSNRLVNLCETSKTAKIDAEAAQILPKFGMTSVCGRRRDMEDAVSVHPSFQNQEEQDRSDLHFFGVFDGHGCSHVATKCKERLHEILKEELKGEGDSVEWKGMMERSFARMDDEVKGLSDGVGVSSCRCELQTSQCDAVGSTAVVAVVTHDKIIVSNCGDSRAVLCRNGVAIPLSSDHKPDRPDELSRIEAAGGRVIYWDGPRVLGVLAMSRAIGDNYLKPYVIPDPEVKIIDRTAEDECLILASDGLWDVVTNDTACGVARMCLRAQKPPSPPRSAGSCDETVRSAAVSSDKACSDASVLLTKLALARHSTDNISVVVVDLKKDQQLQ